MHACSRTAKTNPAVKHGMRFSKPHSLLWFIMQVGACSGCGGHSTELKFCACCRSAKYCSRACQVGVTHTSVCKGLGQCSLADW